MASSAKFVFSGLLLILVSLVFVFAFSLSILLSDTQSLGGLEVVNKTQANNTIEQLDVKIYSSEEDLTGAINRYLSDKDNRLRAGFSTWTPDGKQCTIFVVEPHSEKDFASWGHEIGHCVYGHWHPLSH
ncbi:MAG: hypothetical protein CMP47_12325 [Rickettsiales bacterium]|nr:hypothetical protein [Rickettsiales bacterium]